MTMKKALIAIDLIGLYMKGEGFLDRADIKVLTAASNDAFLKINGQERVDLIVTRIDMPGSITSEKLFEIIRQSEELRKVSIIIICGDSPDHRERCKECGANAVFIKPVDIDLLHVKMRQLLDVAPRQPYREMLQIVDIDGKFGDRAFFGRGENISVKGMLIKTEDIFAPGDQIYFSFFLPDGTQVRVRGEVVRLMKEAPALHVCRYGIRFTDITPEDRSAIEMYVRKK
jgi:CheY-like chemotaxis protein